MEPNYRTPYRAHHKTRGDGVVTRTDSDGVGRQRRPVFAPDSGAEASRVAWGDIEPLGDGYNEPHGIQYEGNTVVIVGPPSRKPQLGEIEDLMREYGLDPEDWVIIEAIINKWEGMTARQYDESDGRTINRKMPLRQWKARLRLKPHVLMAAPAQHVPALPPRRHSHHINQPELIVVEGDHQIPYHDPDLHAASLSMLEYMTQHHNLAEVVFLGDTIDFPTVSKYADHPAAMAPVNECIQGGYDVLRDKAQATPTARKRKLKGNHDWRLEAELLARAERLYGIKPADTAPDKPELPALHLRRLLHLDALDIELVEDPRGWEHAEIELVPGPRGLVVRHGWLTGQGTAEKTLAKRGRSMIVGHKHNRDHVFKWDPGVETERQCVVNGVMCLVRSDRFPHFAPCDDWSQGCVVVVRWPDGDFHIEHALWNGEFLRWRDYRF